MPAREDDLTGIVEAVNKETLTLTIGGVTFPLEKRAQTFIKFRKVGEEIDYTVRTDENGNKTISYHAKAKGGAPANNEAPKEPEEVFLRRVSPVSFSYSETPDSDKTTTVVFGLTGTAIREKVAKFPLGSTIKVYFDGTTLKDVVPVHLAVSEQQEELGRTITEAAANGASRAEIDKMAAAGPEETKEQLFNRLHAHQDRQAGQAAEGNGTSPPAAPVTSTGQSGAQTADPSIAISRTGNPSPEENPVRVEMLLIEYSGNTALRVIGQGDDLDTMMMTVAGLENAFAGKNYRVFREVKS